MGHPTMQENDTAKLTPTSLINTVAKLLHLLGIEYRLICTKHVVFRTK